MPFNFSFRSVEDRKTLDKLTGFVLSHNLRYPHYDAWVEKARGELIESYKRGVVAFSNDIVVGDIIYQPDKRVLRIREIKNIRVHPKLRGRYFASFMLRQVELENSKEYDALLIDARVQNMIRFLVSQGYEPCARLSLYDSNTEDLVLVKFKQNKISQRDRIIAEIRDVLNPI